MAFAFLTTHPQWWDLVFIPLLIFLARIVDVSLGTVRIIFISRGFRVLAPIISFFEILIWLLAITQIMRNIDKPLYYIAYAGGFSAGTYLGMWFENKLAMGVAILRVIAADLSDQALQDLKTAGYGLTCLQGEGACQPVKVLFMIVKRRNIKAVLHIIKQHNPHAVYTIEDVRSVNAATFPVLSHPIQKTERKLFKYVRKGK